MSVIKIGPQFVDDGSGNLSLNSNQNLTITGTTTLSGGVVLGANNIATTGSVSGTSVSVNGAILTKVTENGLSFLNSSVPIKAQYFIGNNNDANSVYGIAWDQVNDTYYRTGTLSGYTARPCSASAGDAFLPVQSLMKRCLLDNSTGAFLGYVDTITQTGSLNGSAGQVMVQIPKFYYKHSFNNNVHTWEISLSQASGLEVHPAFSRNDTQLNYRYYSAYEGSVTQNSATALATGVSASTLTGTATNKLASISGASGRASASSSDWQIAVNGTRNDFRLLASHRGSGWSQLDYDLQSAVQLLYLIEYGNWNSQSMIGRGICDVTDWSSYNGYYPIATTGKSNGLGNITGVSTNFTTGATAVNGYMSYRGIENLYGHVWKFMDGCNTNGDGNVYVCNNTSNFTDNTATNYTNLGIILPVGSDSYQTSLQNISRGFLPSTVGGSSESKITDYYWYPRSGWRGAIVGVAANNGSNDGMAGLDLDLASAYAYSSFGGRLVF